jgi:hypothetical protein
LLQAEWELDNELSILSDLRDNWVTKLDILIRTKSFRIFLF